MRPSVVAIFPTFTAEFEGNCTWMYLDEKCLVTTGRGNLIDPITAAYALPWKQGVGAGGNFGALATHDQVTAEWTKVKGLPSMAKQGGGAFARVTTLRLAPEDVDALTVSKMWQMWGQLLKVFPNADAAPASAQLGLVSMSWAMGPGFYVKFPKFTAAFNACDWWTCAQECKIVDPGNPVDGRNTANEELFAFCFKGGDPEEVCWTPMGVS